MITQILLFQGGLGALGGILPMVLIIGVFYILLIRPQQQRQRKLQETIAQLKAGDRVVTSGGIVGVYHQREGQQLSDQKRRQDNPGNQAISSGWN